LSIWFQFSGIRPLDDPYHEGLRATGNGFLQFLQVPAATFGYGVREEGRPFSDERAALDLYIGGLLA
jgi:hypothetical protein